MFGFMQGPVEYQKEVLEYFKRMGVSIILLRRRNVLKRLISIMANDFDRREKLLNGTHKSHVHSLEEVTLLPFLSLPFKGQEGHIESYSFSAVL